MRRSQLEKGGVVLVFALFFGTMIFRMGNPVAAQATTGNPVLRYVGAPVTAWTAVSSYNCGQAQICIQPAQDARSVTGIAMQDGAVGDIVQVNATFGGAAVCTFTTSLTQTNIGDVVQGGPLGCVDKSGLTLNDIPNTEDILGRIAGMVGTPPTTQGVIAFRIARGEKIMAATTSGFAAVATSGSYTDLSNPPVIPAAQVNSDWNATSGVASILNKPTFTTGPQGIPGSAATVAVGTTSTGAAGSAASVSNSGTSSAAVFNFIVPQGAAGIAGTNGAAGTNGTNGSAATVSIGTTSTGAAGSSAIVTNGGTSSAAVLNFTVPQGAVGATGPSGATLIGTCTVTQTAAVAINAGPRTVASTCTGVVTGGYYFLASTTASLTANAGYGIFAGGTGTATNTLQVSLYAPLLAIGANYTLTFIVYKIG